MERQELFDILLFEELEDGLLLKGVKKEHINDLIELDIPASWNVTAIEGWGNREQGDWDFYQGAFYQCPHLKRVIIPNTVKYLNNAFCSLDELEYVSLPNSLVMFNNSFIGERILKEVDIAEDLKEFGSYNFRRCFLLEDIKLPKGLTRIGYGNFESTPLKYKSDIVEGTDNCYYIDTYLLRNGSYIDCEEEVVIRDGTTLICDCAFSDSNVVNITLPSSLKYIGEQAFYNCEELNEPNLPNGVHIGKEAFENTNCFLSNQVFLCHYEGDKLIRDGLTPVPYEVIQKCQNFFSNYLLRIDVSDYSSYDSSDDDRASDSTYRSSSTVYRDLDIFNYSKMLVVIEEELVGIVIEVHHMCRDDNSMNIFTFDGKIQENISVGYSASHSSQYFYINKIALVKKGVDGVPNDAPILTWMVDDYTSRI